MRIAFLTDIHFCATPAGWQQQPRWCEGTEALMGLLQQYLAGRVDLVVYGGDLVERGTAEQIERAVQQLSRIALPAVVCLGNHDLSERDSHGRWQQALRQWPGATLADTMLEFPDFDLCALNSQWVADGASAWYWDGKMPAADLAPGQLGQLDGWLARRSDRPAIVALHAPVDALPPELTGQAGPIDAPPAAYVQRVQGVLDRYPRVRLVLAGHCHATCATRHNGRVHLSSTSLTEVPYQFPIVEVRDGGVRVQAHRLSPGGSGPAFDPAKAWVVGRAGDREFEV